MENRNNAVFLLNTLESFQKNITISIKETESKMELFDSQFKEITKPLTAIHKTLINLLKSFLDEFKHIQSKFESKSKFIKDFCLNNKSESLSMNLIKDESLLNIQVTKKQSKLIQEIEKINIGIEILKKISQLKEFKQFISLQDKDEDTFNEEAENASLDEESNSTVSNNAHNENSLLTKKTERDDVDSIIEKVRNKRTKKSYKDKDILKKIKKEFKQSHYIQKLTKSFITRRLNRSIIYEHSFEFVNQTVKDKRITTRGDKGIYKYVIFSFETKNTNESLLNYLAGYFNRKYFSQIYKGRVKIGGKLNDQLQNMIKSMFNKTSFYEKFNIKSCNISAYEFYEELSNQFDSSDSSVKIYLDDKTVQKLKENYKMLCIVREYVDKHRQKTPSKASTVKQSDFDPDADIEL